MDFNPKVILAHFSNQKRSGTQNGAGSSKVVGSLKVTSTTKGKKEKQKLKQR